MTSIRTAQTSSAGAAGKVAGPAKITEKDVPGTYVGSIAMEGPYVKAEVNVKADHTYQLRIANIDSGPSPSFSGKWKLEKGVFSGEHTVPGMGKIQIRSDLSKATPASLKAKDNTATITIGGGDLPFTLRKTDQPFF